MQIIHIKGKPRSGRSTMARLLVDFYNSDNNRCAVAEVKDNTGILNTSKQYLLRGNPGHFNFVKALSRIFYDEHHREHNVTSLKDVFYLGDIHFDILIIITDETFVLPVDATRTISLS